MKNWLIICVILLIFTVGCEKTEDDKNITEPSENIGKSVDDKQDIEEKNTEQTEQSTSIDVTYLGQIDANSIEIEMEGEIKAVRLSDTIKDYFMPESSKYRDIQEGEIISITYYINENNQMVLTNIK